MTIPKSSLMNIIHDIHSLYPMECEDRSNILSRVLVCMYELEGGKDQAALAYQQMLPSLHLLRPISTSIDINMENWQRHLGNTSCYRSYLGFFDDQIKRYGMEATMKYFLNAMPPSIHSQLQPIVHFSLGLEHDLPPMVSEGLAYLASTLDDGSSWLLQKPNLHHNQRNDNNTPISFDYLLFDCIQSDPRFNGIMEGGKPIAAKIKMLLKNHGPLLQTYLQQWLVSSYDNDEIQPQEIEQRMNEILNVALNILQMKLLDEPTHQLLASILALRTLYDRQIMDLNILYQWIQIQSLLMICTFIVQGRPSNTVHSIKQNYKQQQHLMNNNNSDNNNNSNTSTTTTITHQDWSNCIQSFITANPPPSSILAMRSLWKAEQFIPLRSCLITANALASHVQQTV
ncbi:hypothetical protein BJ944DRAFT_234113 [Cunninghamella echinulata]|nr:hypothetical protein BJ944DRAFT_234113 [Cunninghamella echinulata]